MISAKELKEAWDATVERKTLLREIRAVFPPPLDPWFLAGLDNRSLRIIRDSLWASRMR